MQFDDALETIGSAIEEFHSAKAGFHTKTLRL
jgi:hypothetical protein